MTDPVSPGCRCGHRPTIEHHYPEQKTFVVCWVCGLRADPVPLYDTRAAIEKWTEAVKHNAAQEQAPCPDHSVL